MATSPLPTRGPKRGRKCFVTPGCAKPSARTQSEVGTSPRPSRGPRRGRYCYSTLAFSGVPNAKRGKKIRSDDLNLAFSGAQKRADLLPNPCILGGPQHQARGQNQKWLSHPYLLGGPNEGRIATHPCILGGPEGGGIVTQPLHSRRSPTPRAGRKSEVATSTLPSEGPASGQNAQHQARGQNQKWLPHPYIVRGPEEGGIAT